MTPEPVLELDSLRVAYGPTLAVDGVSLTVRRGELFGFIGPNGAGKSTCMRVLATIQPPTEGTARVLGCDVLEAPEWIRWRLGYMPDLFGMPEGLTVQGYLELHAFLHALAPHARSSAIDTVLELCDLGHHRHVATSALSKGMRQRLYLARTLLPEPEVLVLDEPASGLDPRARIELRALLRELHSMGKTILISSHVLTELSEVCDSVGIIEQGRVLAQGSVREILKAMRPYVDVRADLLSDPEPARQLVAQRPDTSEVTVSGSRLEFRFQGGQDGLADVLSHLVQQGHRVCGFEVHHGDMEDLFLQVTRGIVS